MNNIRLAALTFALLLSVNGCRSGDPSMAEMQGHLSSGATRAAALARTRFANFIGPEKGHGELGLFLSDVNNYDVTVDERDGNYLVTFRPGRYKGRALKGGGGSYVISRNDFSVVREWHSK